MKLFNKIKNMPHKLVALFATLIVLVGIPTVISMVRAEWYPNRPAFDYSKPCNPNDSDIYDRCGSLTGPVFNSFTNTPSYGDERAFVDARRSDQTAAGSYEDQLQDVTGGSKEIVVRMYVHNNANESTNASGLGVAKNTRVRVFVPTAEETVLRARGYISADNAKILGDPDAPGLVEDTVDFVGDGRKFRVEYIPGSAKLYNNGAFANGVTLSDNIVTNDGALIGDDALDGNLPGCFEYEATVQLRLRVIVEEPEPESDIQFDKRVRLAGEGAADWREEVRAKPGDRVEWLLSPLVTGNGGVQHNVSVGDRGVPNNVVVPGSVKWIDTEQGTVPQNDTSLFTGAINFGNYGTNGGFHVMFTTEVQGDFEGCEVRVRNIASVFSDETEEIEDSADVIITKENCNPPTPEFSCDALTVFRLGDQRYRYTVRYTAEGGAEFRNARFDFGDDTDPMLTTDTTVEHAYETTGRYVARVDLTFRVDGEDRTVTSDACANSIVIPEYSCDSLTARSLGNRRFSFTTAYTVREATFLNVRYNFGDGTQQVVSTNPTVTHTYARDGDYTIRATVTFVVDSEEVMVSSGNCVTRVSALTPVDNCPIPGKTHLPVNSPECREDREYCPIPGKEHLPKNSPECVIVNTGIGDLFGVVAATTVAGAAAHHVLASRRFGRGL